MIGSRVRPFPILMGVAVGTLFLAPGLRAAQDAPSVACEEVDPSSPLEDLTRCAELGDAAAQFSLQQMTPEQVAEAERLSMEWILSHALDGEN